MLAIGLVAGQCAMSIIFSENAFALCFSRLGILYAKAYCGGDHCGSCSCDHCYCCCCLCSCNSCFVVDRDDYLGCFPETVYQSQHVLSSIVFYQRMTVTLCRQFCAGVINKSNLLDGLSILQAGELSNTSLLMPASNRWTWVVQISTYFVWQDISRCFALHFLPDQPQIQLRPTY